MAAAARRICCASRCIICRRRSSHGSTSVPGASAGSGALSPGSAASGEPAAGRLAAQQGMDACRVGREPAKARRDQRQQPGAGVVGGQRHVFEPAIGIVIRRRNGRGVAAQG
jgi:hypothetical protein